MKTFSDRLVAAVRQYGPLCVGLDPRWECLPVLFRKPGCNPAQGVEAFCRRVLELVRPYAGVVKPQAAFFEWLGPEGLAVMQRLLAEARSMGFVTILDAKRGDIASTAQAYAEAAFTGFVIDGESRPVWDADALTINPYLGEDSVEPFLSVARQSGRGLFVLVRTSNPGAGLFQDQLCGGQPLYRLVAEAVNRWNEPTVGSAGLGDVGAVVGATHPRELRELREAMPHVWFLVPGYGAQGGTATDVKAAYRPDGLGAIVNSSRGITFPFAPDDPDWERMIATAARVASEALRA